MPNTYTQLLYHAVFATRRREPTILVRHEARLHAYIGGIVREEGGELLAAGGMAEHIHLVLRLSPKHALSDVMRVIKSKSSGWMNELDDYPAKFFWQRGYSAFTVSRSQIERVIEYVLNQKAHHATRGYQQELRTLLKSHDVQFSEEFLWNDE